MLSRIRGYRTLVINALTAIVVGLGAVTGNIDDPAVLQWIVLILAGANFALRFLTSTKVGSSV